MWTIFGNIYRYISVLDICFPRRHSQHIDQVDSGRSADAGCGLRGSNSATLRPAHVFPHSRSKIPPTCSTHGHIATVKELPFLPVHFYCPCFYFLFNLPVLPWRPYTGRTADCYSCLCSQLRIWHCCEFFDWLGSCCFPTGFRVSAVERFRHKDGWRIWQNFIGAFWEAEIFSVAYSIHIHNDQCNRYVENRVTYYLMLYLYIKLWI